MAAWYLLNFGWRKLSKSYNGGIRGHPTLLLSIMRYAIGSEADPVHNLYVIYEKLTRLMLYRNIV